MNGLGLCAGIGGLELGIKLAIPGYRTVCWVESDPKCQEFLVQRFGNGLDEAPIWDNIKTFDAQRWCGKVDIISAGFPCQPFSSAGTRKGIRDDRYLWPYIARTIIACGPRFAFLENVRKNAFDEAIPELRGMGYQVKGGTFSSAEVGAGHLRRRCFVLAYSDEKQLRLQSGRSQGPNGKETPLFEDYSRWRTTEPEVARVVHGLPNRVAQERALGNSVDPWVAKLAWETLTK